MNTGEEGLSTTAADNDGNGSVSSVGTDRASNHNNNRTNKEMNQLQQQQQVADTPPPLYSPNSPTLPVPTTVVAAIDAPNALSESAPSPLEEPIKLTAEALAKQNQALLQQGDINMINNRMNNNIRGSPGIFGNIVEVSSNLSRSSSDNSGYLKNLYSANSGISNINSSSNGNGDGNLKSSNASSIPSSGSGAATPAHFQPFEDVSSLGSLAEDALQPTMSALEEQLVPLTDIVSDTTIDACAALIIDNNEGTVGQVHEVPIRDTALMTDSILSPSGSGRLSNRVLSDMALSVHPTLSSETPPKDNLSSSLTMSGKVTNNLVVFETPAHGTTSTSQYDNMPIPIELASLHPTPHTPPRTTPTNQAHVVNRLLPMGGGSSAPPVRHVNVDSTIASIRPPSAPPSPYPASPKPPPAIRISNDIAYSPNLGIHRPNNNKKATFQVENPTTTLTRSSSNASSQATNTTNNSALNRTERIRLGVCAMDKKARSKPMAEILKRLDISTFDSVFFGDDLILNEPVENWPVCDVLIAFYSNGYPLEKAERYVALRQPYLLNDLKMQRTLMDRRRVYDLLEESGIDVPRHVFMSRDGYVSKGTGDGPKEGSGRNDNTSYHGGCIANDEPEIDEHDDHIEVNGVVINKPFVEKPVDADDHNIAIYYPSSAGGGCKKLFRKVGDRSSEFYPEINDIRRDGSYIYEEFIETQGTDVKMYTVGPDYGHAEARKSPAVDGKVERNEDGKEVRFPVILTLREKEIARRIVLVFKQQVCGFDILRIQEGDSLVSYVCDVNGWSFVKNSRKYYDDCAQILTEHMLAALKPKSKVSFSALAPLLATMEDPFDNVHSGGKSNKKKKEKKKGMHHRGPSRGQSIADRVKLMLMGENGAEEDDDGVKDEENDKVSDLQQRLEDRSDGSNGNSVGLGDTYEEPIDYITNPVRNIPDQLATEPASSASIVPSGNSSLADPDDFSQSGKENGAGVATTTHQEELRCVITIIRHGDRTPKQKLKGKMDGEHFLEYFHNHTKKVKKDLKVKAKKNMVEFLETVKAVISDMESDSKKNRDALYKARHIRDILQRWKFSGLNRKLQMKPQKWIKEEAPDGGKSTKCSELQLIVKWGGDLTKLGERQAVRLGNRLRNELYPSNKGIGILRLHSTFRHDLKIKTSDEGRVMKTAAAFAKGMLELEGDIPPILVSLVHKEKDSKHMLDPSGNKEVKMDLEKCKEMININMQKDVDYDKMTKEERESLVGPERLVSLHRALKEIGNPRKTLIAIHSTIGQLVEQLDEMLGELLSGDEEVTAVAGREGLDEALSGIKLYKGETLLELTERWKLLYNRLYNEEEDKFDLSRVPDAHDNVRFDMLHNKHLGLTETLQKLYDLAKSMADCVVPQEYGITIEEKRDIGSKMCHTLLEKINYDLAIARTDNQVDMRYLINMDYSADLPINSMGRRVRSRLYFTSESHLHSMLNMLRFPSIVPSPLSLNGQEILANASELCYLTQVAFRLFEDTQKPSDDPRRFRVEILFSPGATATPLHMAELFREKDATRFDTEKLQKISIDGLTCAQVEEYFTEAIREGKTNDEDEDVVEKTPSVKKKKDKGKKDKIPKEELTEVPSITKQATTKADNIDGKGTKANTVDVGKASAESQPGKKKTEPENVTDNPEACADDSTNESRDSDSKYTLDKSANYFSRHATVFGVLIGAGCLFMISRATKGMLKSGR